MFRFLVSCTMLCLGASAYAPTVARRAPGTGEQFGLYAYGESVGGLSLFYADGQAQIGDPANSAASEVSSVYFESSDSTWVGNPNGTTSGNSSWSDQMLYIPSSSSSSHQMGFTSKNMSNVTTTGFIFYGNWMMVESDSGEISSSFYVRENSQGEGIYSLLWNVSDETTAIPVSLRSVKPSNA
ncbi:hypothetical protein N7465_005391 [Penicillium sp. CMV-2018d]|nr:hypothetical protein N7465_005391 [Penicillium sp. CMV-2018d]